MGKVYIKTIIKSITIKVKEVGRLKLTCTVQLPSVVPEVERKFLEIWYCS